MVKTNKRLVFPDKLKGFLIYLVILGHLIGLNYKSNMDDYWSNPIIFIIYSFHMPLFIAISGFFAGVSKKTSLHAFINGKLRRLLYPIISIAIISFLIDICFHCITNEGTHIVKSIYKYFNMYWYLDCLLLCSLIIKICEFMGKSMIISVCLLFLAFIILYDRLPSVILKDMQLIRQFPIYTIAYFLGKQKNRTLLFWNNYKHYSIISIVLWLLIGMRYGVNLMHYPCYIRVFVGLFSSLCVVYILYLLRHYLPSYLSIIGINSLGIYIIHVPIFKCLPEIHNYYLIVLLSFILLIVSHFTTNLIKKTYISRYLIGE